jgi:hypothetical protein
MENLEYMMRPKGSHHETELRRFCRELKNIVGDSPSIVELGSYMGESSLIFSQEFPNGKIYCIDIWENIFDYSDPYTNHNFNLIEGQFDKRLSLTNNITKLKGLSTSYNIECDVVYIDACHKYEFVVGDINHWLPLTKKVISGHDYYLDDNFRKGNPHIAEVKIAVDDLLGRPDNIFNDGSWFKILHPIPEKKSSYNHVISLKELDKIFENKNNLSIGIVEETKILKSMVTVHVVTYNEELMIEFFVKHYRENFPNCIIKVYDNYSTDNTVEIAKKLNCEISYFYTNNQMSDSKFLEIKNNFWKTAETDWVIICDCDELIDINQEDLIYNHKNGITAFQFEGYDMVNYEDNINLESIVFGNRNTLYDKTLLFNKKSIKEINYSPGCHICSISGNKVLSKHKYKLLHYKYIGVDFTISRHKLFYDRLSEENHRHKWSYHYKQNENEIRDYYKSLEKKVIRIK